VAFVSYLSSVVPLLNQSPLNGAMAAVATIWAVTLVNLRGVRQVGGLQVVTTVLKILPLLLVAGAGLWGMESAHFTPFNRSDQSLPLAVAGMVCGVIGCAIAHGAGTTQLPYVAYGIAASALGMVATVTIAVAAQKPARESR